MMEKNDLELHGKKNKKNVLTTFIDQSLCLDTEIDTLHRYPQLKFSKTV